MSTSVSILQLSKALAIVSQREFSSVRSGSTLNANILSRLSIIAKRNVGGSKVPEHHFADRAYNSERHRTESLQVAAAEPEMGCFPENF